MRFIKTLFLLFFIALLAGAGVLAAFAWSPLSLRTPVVDFSIRAGSGLRSAARQMSEAGLGFAPWQFELLARLLGQEAKIKAGSYEARSGLTPLALLDKLTRGDVTQTEVVFIEGWTFRQIRAALDAHPELRHDSAGLSEREILTRLGAQETSGEGLFFPDTYLAAKGSSDLDVLRRSYRLMSARLNDEWQKRAPGLPLATPYEALILASIVEKETGLAADRPKIASVFINRLRLGMRLQSDPTVIYGLGERFDGNLRKADLLADTPYNSYTRAGLPPTPIAAPSLASIQAVLAPPQTPYLYFVARGDGSSVFSRSLDEHNRAVDRYQRRHGG